MRELPTEVYFSQSSMEGTSRLKEGDGVSTESMGLSFFKGTTFNSDGLMRQSQTLHGFLNSVSPLVALAKDSIVDLQSFTQVSRSNKCAGGHSRSD